MTTPPGICPYCQASAQPTTGREIYPGRADLARLNFWICRPCDAYVGCHRHNPKHGFYGWEPLGRLADKELRKEKTAAHRAFDQLWRGGVFSRAKAYRWLSRKMDLPVEETHIGMFDVDQCRQVVALVNQHYAATEFAQP